MTTISAISATATVQAAAGQQPRQDFSSMMSAIRSGDVSSAQQSYASLTANRTPAANSPLFALGQALQSGDINSIQRAAQELQAARHGQHPHQSNQSSSSPSATSSSAGGSDGTLINISC